MFISRDLQLYCDFSWGAMVQIYKGCSFQRGLGAFDGDRQGVWEGPVRQNSEIAQCAIHSKVSSKRLQVSGCTALPIEKVWR